MAHGTIEWHTPMTRQQWDEDIISLFGESLAQIKKLLRTGCESVKINHDPFAFRCRLGFVVGGFAVGLDLILFDFAGDILIPDGHRLSTLGRGTHDRNTGKLRVGCHGFA